MIDLYVLKRKSENMNLKFKSSEPDLKFNIQVQLRILNQNLLYQTKQSDTILRRLDSLINSMNLQKQVDEFFEDSKQEEEDKEPD